MLRSHRRVSTPLCFSNRTHRLSSSGSPAGKLISTSDRMQWSLGPFWLLGSLPAVLALRMQDASTFDAWKATACCLSAILKGVLLLSDSLALSLVPDRPLLFRMCLSATIIIGEGFFTVLCMPSAFQKGGRRASPPPI